MLWSHAVVGGGPATRIIAYTMGCATRYSCVTWTTWAYMIALTTRSVGAAGVRWNHE
jgi:hypothetical protein